MDMAHFRRFQEKYEPCPNTGCWLWVGARSDDGYGHMMVPEGMRRAHRLAFEHFRSEIPDGLVIDHLCRNPLCVNPEHLDAVTQRENTLRGNGPAALNARKTHCKRGHELSPENLIHRNPQKPHARQCRLCKNILQNERNQKLREAAKTG